MNSPKYHQVLDLTQRIAAKNKYMHRITTSHDLVAYLMIFMNYQCAKEMIKHKTGIFRSAVMRRPCIIPDSVPEEASKFIKLWNSASGQYVKGEQVFTGEQVFRHELLDVDAYIHISSPIRRLVDLLNMIRLQQVLNILPWTESARTFYHQWLNELDYINTTMRAIRKVQTECSLLDLCTNHPDIMDKEYVGYVFDKLCRNDGLYQYVVFLPELTLTSRITTRENMENFEMKRFKPYLFTNEEKFKRKIRLHCVG